MKKIWVLVLVCVCFFSGCGCNNVVKTSIFSSPIKAYLNKENNDFTIVEPFNTYISISGYDEDNIKSVETKFNELVYKYHSLLDNYYYYKDSEGNYINNVKVINDKYGDNEGVVVDSIIIEILKEGIKFTKLSNGKFNIFAGSIVSVWEERFNTKSSLYKVDPSQKEIDDAMKCVLRANEIDEYFVIDEENNKVIFRAFDGCDTGASINLGALGKSYFLDKLVKEKAFSKIESAIYDAGQSSIIIKGENIIRDNKEWLIGISDSVNEGNVLQISLVGDNSLSTSSYKGHGYVKEDGNIRHHIIDAMSGCPKDEILSVTVVGESAMIVDVISTTIMTMDEEEVKRYLLSLESIGIEVRVLLQIKENNQLKILVNDSMKDIIKEVYNGTSVEVFNYGTQA